MDSLRNTQATPTGSTESRQSHWIIPLIVGAVASIVGAVIASILTPIVQDAIRSQPCIVGRWEASFFRQSFKSDGGDLEFELTQGSLTVQFDSDGTGSADTGPGGMTASVTHTTDPQLAGKAVRLVTYTLGRVKWSISGNVLTITDIDQAPYSGHSESYVDGTKTEIKGLRQAGPNAVLRFRCSSSALTLAGDNGYEARFTRSGYLASILTAGSITFTVIAVIAIVVLYLRARKKRTRRSSADTDNRPTPSESS